MAKGPIAAENHHRKLHIRAMRLGKLDALEKERFRGARRRRQTVSGDRVCWTRRHIRCDAPAGANRPSLANPQPRRRFLRGHAVSEQHRHFPLTLRQGEHQAPTLRRACTCRIAQAGRAVTISLRNACDVTGIFSNSLQSAENLEALWSAVPSETIWLRSRLISA